VKFHWDGKRDVSVKRILAELIRQYADSFGDLGISQWEANQPVGNNAQVLEQARDALLDDSEFERSVVWEEKTREELRDGSRDATLGG
jgi:hypothetical protein